MLEIYHSWLAHTPNFWLLQPAVVCPYSRARCSQHQHFHFASVLTLLTSGTEAIHRHETLEILATTALFSSFRIWTQPYRPASSPMKQSPHSTSKTKASKIPPHRSTWSLRARSDDPQFLTPWSRYPLPCAFGCLARIPALHPKRYPHIAPLLHIGMAWHTLAIIVLLSATRQHVAKIE